MQEESVPNVEIKQSFSQLFINAQANQRRLIEAQKEEQELLQQELAKKQIEQNINKKSIAIGTSQISINQPDVKPHQNQSIIKSQEKFQQVNNQANLQSNKSIDSKDQNIQPQIHDQKNIQYPEPLVDDLDPYVDKDVTIYKKNNNQIEQQQPQNIDASKYSPYKDDKPLSIIKDQNQIQIQAQQGYQNIDVSKYNPYNDEPPSIIQSQQKLNKSVKQNLDASKYNPYNDDQPPSLKQSVEFQQEAYKLDDDEIQRMKKNQQSQNISQISFINQKAYQASEVQMKEKEVARLESPQTILLQLLNANWKIIEIRSNPRVHKQNEELGPIKEFDDQFNQEDLQFRVVEQGEDSLYIGQIKDNLKHGIGFDISVDESVYLGYFINNKRHIYGRIIYRNLDYFVGEWKEDARDGQGEEHKVDGEVYIGQFRNNCREGQGILRTHQFEYDGQFEQNKISGQGIMRFLNGDQYTGEFFKNQIHGYGQYKSVNNIIRKGQWKQGKLHGEGEQIYQNQDKFKGFFNNGQKEGQGELKTAKGTFKGTWQNNQRQGKFLYSYQHQEKEIFFIDDKPQIEN